MQTFETSLLREKFIIHDLNNKDEAKPLVATGNRMVCPMLLSDGRVLEEFVVRAQNMHCCIRMCARLLHAFQTSGGLLNRRHAFDWEGAWKVIHNDYERLYNPEHWVSIYHEGSLVFEYGERPSLVDVIEKCAVKHKKVYDVSISEAESMLEQSGKNVRIDYDGNIALVTNAEDGWVRCGIILRDANRTATFNFLIRKKEKGRPVSVPPCLSAAAAYLEAIQLSFLIGMNTEKLRIGQIKKHSDEAKQTREASSRLARLNTEISNLETSFNVRYRPERPSFEFMRNNAENLAKKLLDSAKMPDNFIDMEADDDEKATSDDDNTDNPETSS